MTEAEKKSTWDGVLRRAGDYPNGKTPYAGDPLMWDGVLRRKTDFPSGVVLPFNTENNGSNEASDVRNDDTSRQNTRGLPALSHLSKHSQTRTALLWILASLIVILILCLVIGN